MNVCLYYYIKVIHLRKSNYRHNFRCKCGFCRCLNRLWVCLLLRDWVCGNFVCLHNTTPGIPNRLLESLGSSDGLVSVRAAVPKLLRRPNTQINRHIAWRQVARWCSGILGKVRVVLLSCAVCYIGAHFPPPLKRQWRWMTLCSRDFALQTSNENTDYSPYKQLI